MVQEPLRREGFVLLFTYRGMSCTCGATTSAESQIRLGHTVLQSQVTAGILGGNLKPRGVTVKAADRC